MGIIKEVENYLENKFSRSYCIFTGSGTTAIYILLKSLRLNEKDTILLPGICCFSVAYAVKYAGLKLDFCDVSIEDGCISTKAIELALKKNPAIKAVIGVHLFGNVLDMDAISNICKKRKIIFIEDVCQAYGSYYKKRLCGSFENYSVLSFGHTKILDSGRGGAVLTDNIQDAEIIRDELCKLRKYDNKEHDMLSMDHSNKYYEFQQILRNNPEKAVLFEKLLNGFMDLFIHGVDYSSVKKLKVLFKNENKIISHRKKLLALYRKKLKNIKNIRFLGSDNQIVPWRFSFLMNQVDIFSLCDELRSEGFDISTWYPNLANMFVSDNTRKLTNANHIENSVLNLWLDESIDEQGVAVICSRMIELSNNHLLTKATRGFI